MRPQDDFPYAEDPLIRKMRILTWYRAVQLAYEPLKKMLEAERRSKSRPLIGGDGQVESSAAMRAEVTPGDLARYFPSDRRANGKRSCLWNKYARGEVLPRSGYLESGTPNLVERVEAKLPGTAKWLSLPLWRLADRSPMGMDQIRHYYEGLPVHVRSWFIDENATPLTVFWKVEKYRESVFRDILAEKPLDAFTVLLIMIKDAETTQDRTAYRFFVLQLRDCISSCSSYQEMQPTTKDLWVYLRNRFQSAW